MDPGKESMIGKESGGGEMGGIVTKVRDGKSQQGTMVISDKALECNSRDRDVG